MSTTFRLMCLTVALASNVNAFARTGGPVVETLDGRPIDTSAVEVSDLSAFVVRPGDGRHAIEYHQDGAGFRVTVRDHEGRVLGEMMPPVERAGVHLAAATAEPEQSWLQKDGKKLAGAAGVLLGLQCLIKRSTCRWFGAYALGYIGIAAFDRADQRRREQASQPSAPAPAVDAAPRR